MAFFFFFFAKFNGLKGGAKSLKDLCSISLVGELYKLLTVLANKLNKVVEKVVSNFQHAFAEGRQILDAMIIANENFNSRLKGLESGIISKMDIVKTYDHVNWDFLPIVMEKM